MKNSNNKNENSIEKIENSNENSQISNEKIENSNEKIEKISQNSNKKNENSNKKNENNEKIPYYKRYYQKHKEEIKARRLQRLKEKQEQENKDLKVIESNSNNELKTSDKIKVGFWFLTQEVIIGIFILSLIVGLIVYKWFFKKDNENQEVNE